MIGAENMSKSLFYIPSYKGWTKAEKQKIQSIKGHENILELFEHGILTKQETLQAIELLYS